MISSECIEEYFFQEKSSRYFFSLCVPIREYVFFESVSDSTNSFVDQNEPIEPIESIKPR